MQCQNGRQGSGVQNYMPIYELSTCTHTESIAKIHGRWELSDAFTQFILFDFMLPAILAWK